MANVESIRVKSQEKMKSHKIEITVEFDEPVTAFEAERVTLEALSKCIYDVKFE